MKDILKYFDKIYCINKDDRTDRWDIFKNEFQKTNVSLDRLNRHSASPWEQLPQQYRGQAKIGEYRQELQYRAASLSHLEIIKEAKQQNLKNVLVFEDDCSFCHVSQILPTIDDLKQENWDIFKFGGKLNNCKIDILTDNLFVYKGRDDLFYHTHAIAYNHTSFDHILSHADEFVNGVVDRWVTMNFDIYASRYLIGFQRDPQSEAIHTYDSYYNCVERVYDKHNNITRSKCEAYLHENIYRNKPWYHGLRDTWWYGMNEDQFLETHLGPKNDKLNLNYSSEDSMKHIIVFPYWCKTEIDKFMILAEHWNELTKTDKDYEFLLVARSDCDLDVSVLMKKLSKYKKVSHYKCEEPIKQFGNKITNVNYMFSQTLEFIDTNYDDDGGFMLWFEHDMMFTCLDWLDRLEGEWKRYSPKLMGHYVTEDEPISLVPPHINPHINGGACYSKDIKRLLPQNILLTDNPFDLVILPELIKANAKWHPSILFDFRMDKWCNTINIDKPLDDDTVIAHGCKTMDDFMVLLDKVLKSKDGMA